MTTKKRFIVFKIQRPLMSTDPNTPWLVYDKKKNYILHIPESEVSHELKAMMGKHHKIYVKAHLEDNTLIVHEEVKSQTF